MKAALASKSALAAWQRAISHRLKTIENGISGSGGEMAGGIENGGSDIRNGQAKIRRLASMAAAAKEWMAAWRNGERRHHQRA
jgi:hypothetical protein